MFLFFKLAFRNLIRNRMRTALNLTMVIGAFTAIIIFRGFSNYMISAIEKSTTQGATGHIQIAKPAVWTGDFSKDKENDYIQDTQKMTQDISTVNGVKHAVGRTHSYSLLVNSDKSVGAFIIGIDPKVETNVQNYFEFVEGSALLPDSKHEILLGAGLKKSLQLSVGQTISIVSQTLAGSISSLDVELKGFVKTGLSEVDNSTAYLPITMVQKLLGTDRAERIVILLNKDANLDVAVNEIHTKLKNFPDLEVKSWKESATLYKQLTDFYKIQNTMIEVILACLVFFGILNTLGMSIYERMGEIGTLRALGDRSGTVFSQIMLEGLTLGIIGVLIATPLSLLLCVGISAMNIHVLMPGATRTMPIGVMPVTEDFLVASFVVIITCVTASFWPTQKALRLSIVEALRANS